MAGLVGLALTSCKEDNSLGTMQKNEAPIIVLENGVALQSLFNATGNSINLQNYQGVAQIPLVDIEIDASFPENSTITGEVEIADNADFNNAQTISLSAVEAADTNESLQQALNAATRSYTGVVNCTAWNDAFVTFYGLNPAANVNFVRYRLWLNNEKQNVILYDNNGNEWFDPMEFMVTPLDAQLDVNSEYWLNYQAGSGSVKSVLMYHNPDKHVYDDPNFNGMVEVGEDETVFWWITTDENGSNPYGVEASDPTAETGNLGKITDNTYTKGQISTAGVYKVSVNMLELTYTVKLSPNSLYVMSTSGLGTNFSTAPQLGTSDNVVYEGMGAIFSAWGLTGQASYRPTLYVNNPDVAVTSSNGTVTGGMMLDTSGAPLNANSAIPRPGNKDYMYYITANLSTQTYTAYLCNTMGFVGSINNWGNPDDAGVVTPDVALTTLRSNMFLEWTGTLTVKAGDEWKIRANSEWVVNFGGANGGSYATDGSPVELSMGGDNFVAAEDGTYNVKVYLKRQYDADKKAMTPYYMTITPAQ